ncbi:Hypothetical protein GLP15_1069 [Giardia lamblia P15]|uniref:GPI-anchored wall transfer protein 1 n=1 Tax=Giardia intestinalis (strain P15) TaxID=658858 RepID=E1F2M9_GIAIA|nr:Hypothetical protein GLP15_1069 [Giardia lamblia P15]
MVWVGSLLYKFSLLPKTVDTLTTVISGYMIALVAPHGRVCVLITLALLSSYGGTIECIVLYAVIRHFQLRCVGTGITTTSTSNVFKRTLRLATLGFTAVCIHEIDTGILPAKHRKSSCEADHLSLMDTGLGYFIISDALSSINRSRLYWKEQIYLLIAGMVRVCLGFYLPNADKEEYGPYWNSFLTMLSVRFLGFLTRRLKKVQSLFCIGTLMGLNQVVLTFYPQSPILRFAGPWAAVLGYFPLYILTQLIFTITQDYSNTNLRQLIILALLCFSCFPSKAGVNAHFMSPAVVSLLLATTYCCWILTLHHPCGPVPPVRGRWAFLSTNILTGMYKILKPRGVYFTLFEIVYIEVFTLCLG